MRAPTLTGAPPGTRRGPAPATGTGPNRHDAAAAKQQVYAEGTTRQRQAQQSTPHEVWAQVVVVAGRLRPRALLVVHCAFCGLRHVHHATPSVLTTVRKASCGHGSYRIHAGITKTESAA